MEALLFRQKASDADPEGSGRTYQRILRDFARMYNLPNLYNFMRFGKL